MTKIKICGVNSAAAFDAVVDAGADYLGFVFFRNSPRFVTATQAAALQARHKGGPQRVGLFVEPEPASIVEILRVVPLDILQIYGTAALCREIRSASGLNVWRAVGIAQPSDLPMDSQTLDGFVIEAKAPANATRPGGNATTMDWGLLKDWHAPAPWLLGGGLNASNVAQAIADTNAPGVDVSSGVETKPGEKSAVLIQDFVASVRNATARNKALL